MKSFQTVNREFVAPVDLQTLGKSFDTLEEGHQKAVQVASALREEIAKLPLNESEDMYKQELLNSIQQTITDNTMFGNSYNALDDLTRQLGDIKSNPLLLGKIKNQQEYKTFIDNIDKSNMPENYKNYFRNNNPYRSIIKKDDKGNIIGTEDWKPTVSPTPIVAKSEILAKGVALAAKESGSGTITRFVDENGNVSQNPTENAEIFSTTTNSWERLSKDKIWKGIKAYIKNTPGALESIKQDFDIETWEHNENAKKSNKVIVDNVTNDKGELLDLDEYIRKSFNEGVDAASYYNSNSSTNYSSGYFGSANRASKQRSGSGSSSDNISTAIDFSLDNRNMPIKQEVNKSEQLANDRGILQENIKDEYHKLTGGKLIIKPGIGHISVEDVLNKHKVKPQDRLYINSLIKAYNENTDNLELLTANMSNKDKNDYIRAISGYSDDRIKSDKEIKLLNNLWGNNANTAIISVDNNTLNYIKENELLKKFNGKVYIDTNNKIIINRQNKEFTGEIAKIISIAQSKGNTGFFSIFTQPKLDDVDIILKDKNGKIINTDNKTNYNANTDKVYTNRTNYFKSLADISKTDDKIIENLNKKYGIKTEDTFSLNKTIIGKSFTDNLLDNLHNQGKISDDNYKSQKEKFKDFTYNLLSELDSNYTVYGSNKDNTYFEKLSNNDAFDALSEIKSAYLSNKESVTITPAYTDGTKDNLSGINALGYNITVVDKEHPDKIKRYYIPGAYSEQAALMLSQTSKIQSKNSIDILKRVGGTKIVNDNAVDRKLHTATITSNNNGFFISYNNIKRNTNDETAQAYNTAWNDYNNIKSYTKVYGVNSLNKQQQANLLNSIDTIADCLNVSREAMFNELYNALQ